MARCPAKSSQLPWCQASDGGGETKLSVQLLCEAELPRCPLGLNLRATWVSWLPSKLGGLAFWGSTSVACARPQAQGRLQFCRTNAP